MKEFIDGLWFPKCTWGERLKLYYFVVSMFGTCIDADLWIMVLVLVNFGIATALVRTVNLKHLDNEQE